MAHASDRHWAPGSVDLSPYLGQPIDLVLQTRAIGSGLTLPVWGDLRLSPAPDPGQFKQVYAGEVSIWENTHAAPRAFLVGRVERADSSAEAIARMQAPDFDPLQMAIVEGGANLPAAAEAATAGRAGITLYTQQRVEVAIEAAQPALLVLTDSYYPGWTAHLDGAETPILPADVAFRGVPVPPGAHQVTFEYVPASFWIGVTVAVAALALLGLALWRLPHLAGLR
jgi:hypothetical protein